MAFKKLSSFLSSINFYPVENIVKKEATKLLLEINIPAEDTAIKIRENVIYIGAKNQTIKNEIFLNKKDILQKLKTRLKSNKKFDIRFF